MGFGTHGYLPIGPKICFSERFACYLELRPAVPIVGIVNINNRHTLNKGELPDTFQESRSLEGHEQTLHRTHSQQSELESTVFSSSGVSLVCLECFEI